MSWRRRLLGGLLLATSLTMGCLSGRLGRTEDLSVTTQAGGTEKLGSDTIRALISVALYERPQVTEAVATTVLDYWSYGNPLSSRHKIFLPYVIVDPPWVAVRTRRQLYQLHTDEAGNSTFVVQGIKVGSIRRVGDDLLFIDSVRSSTRTLSRAQIVYVARGFVSSS